MVYIAEVSRKGKLHPERNEDNYYYLKEKNRIVGGIFDGCSTGQDSYFASKLFANVLRETLNKNLEKLSTNTFPDVVHLYIKELVKAKQVIGLNQEETLTTALLFYYDIFSEELFVKFFGDGVVFLNTSQLETFNNDEQNQPDYLGYSLTKLIKKNEFNRYWQEKQEVKKVTRDFTLSSDGIFSFRKTTNEIPEFNIEDFIARDNFLATNPAALKRKLNIINKKGYEHYDDFTALRVIKMQNNE